MAFERNDIVNKTRLAGELGEELMGFEHNDIVTVDVMNEAIEEGGGGGDNVTWLIDNVSLTAGTYGEAVVTLPESITADNLLSTFADKLSVTMCNGIYTKTATIVDQVDNRVTIGANVGNNFSTIDFSSDTLSSEVYFGEQYAGQAVTFSLGIVED